MSSIQLIYRWKDLPWLIGTAVLYAVLAKVTLSFYSSNGLVTIFWPGAGVSLAALLLGGRKFWPSIYVGAFVGEMWVGHTAALAAVISSGSMLEPILGAWLLTRKGGFSVSLQSARDIYRLYALAGLLSPVICALLGVSALLVSGGIGGDEYWRSLAIWWMGDTLGIVVVAPFILAWHRPPRIGPAQAVEAAIVIAISFIIGQIIFLDWFHDLFGLLNRGYWMYLVITWAAIRLGLHGVLFILLVALAQALVGVAHGVGFFGNDLAKTHLTNFWAYTMILSTVGMSLAVIFSERKKTETALRQSELGLRNAQHLAGLGSWRWNVRTGAHTWSTEIFLIYGRDPSLPPAVYPEVRRYFTPESWDRLAAAVEKGLADGTPYECDAEVVRPDGSHRWIVARGQATRDADGTVVELYGTVQDITERMQVIARLHESEERLRLAQDVAELGIFDHDLLADTIQCNANLRALWGLGSDVPVTYDMIEGGIHPEDRAARKAAVLAALDSAGDGKYHAEYRVVGLKDARERFVATTGKAFFAEGRAVRFIGVVQDITNKKRIEKELQERRGELERLLKQQVAIQTAAAIAHELNQPLVAVSAYSEAALRVLRAGIKSPDKLARALEGNVQQAQRAGRTLHELLDFLHRGEVEAAPFDLNDLIQEAVATAHDEGYGDFHPALELAPGLRPVLGNRLQMEKVIVNLLHNGVEAMREGGMAPGAIVISVRTAGGHNMAQVTVRDSGPGLDGATAQRLFEPFFTTKPHGMGLGLAISRAMVEAQGGQLWFEQDSGPGATFHITLPFSP